LVITPTPGPGRRIVLAFFALLIAESSPLLGDTPDMEQSLCHKAALPGLGSGNMIPAME
jgi:hypothetical protein